MKEKILVVDDMKSLALMLEIYLSNAGYDVSTSYSFTEARQELSKTDFNLVLTDVDLGEGKTGIDILKEVKKTNPTCHVIIITANRDYMVASDARLFGAYDYLLKPVEFEGLLYTVSMALRYKKNSNGNANSGEQYLGNPCPNIDELKNNYKKIY
ncbi:response regulator [Candidatus Scalindua japonica]|uniref:Response regulator n=1 Tax=Candidatus Scalindua japonica TaxID=1284222 RepID=A0A286U1Z6_9BACT|nr:response regulator [Candidatus Scalindua japonica]GAX62146.1 response regulator [Candidatus Scalindua japonica]